MARDDSSASADSEATVHEEADGIIVIAYATASRVNLETAHSTFRRRRAMLTASGKKRHRIIIHGTRIVSFDYAAYRFSASREVSATVAAAALVCDSMLERHLASVFVNMWKPSYPTRIFTDMSEARAWLRTFPDN